MRAVIVGNGPAAASAVKAFREVDRESSVVIISPERYPTYAPNCMENVIRDDILPEALFYTGGERFYERYRVELYLGKEAVRIDTKKKVVMTADGGEIPYDVCLLAAGAKPFIPPIEGIGLKGITTAKTLDDAIRIRKWITSGKVRKAVVLGAGPIGIEDAETLHHMGVDVSVVEILDRVLPRMLDPQMGRAYAQAFQRETGIKIYLEHGAVAFHGKEWVESVEIKPTDSDRSLFIETDMVILSTGVRPRTYLVEGTDIKLHGKRGGILVDEYQRTSDLCVFAAGDIASSVDVWGNHRWIALFPAAQQCGYVAGFNMAGKKVKNLGTVDYNAVKTRTVTAGSGGLFEDAEEEMLVESGNYLIKVFFREGTVIGYQFVGLPRRPSINPRNRFLGMMTKIRDWEEKVLNDRGLGLEASGVLFHFFLKLRRGMNVYTKRALERMLLRALANPSYDTPLYGEVP